MRLIDADKLLNKIDAYMCGSQDVMFVKELIKEQPTAFDVDKVERELEEKVENSNLNIQIICFSQALDIFKGGKNE